MDKRYKRLGKNSALVFLGRAGSKLIGLIMLPFYTKFMSTAEYGVSDIIYTYSAIIVGFVSCCIADAIFIFPKDSDENGRKKYYSSGFIFSICTFTVCALLFFILDRINSGHHIGGTFFEMIWWLFAFAASDFFQNYTQQFTMSIDKIKVYSISGVVLTVAMALIALVLMPSLGLQGYLISMVAAKIITGLFTILASGSYRFLSFHSFDLNYLKPLLAYGIPLIPNGIMWWLVNGINRPIMEATLGLSAIGIYAVAGKFPGLLNMLFSIFSNAWGITMLEEFKSSDFNRFFNKTIKVLFFVTVLGGCVVVVSSKVLIKIFATPEYFDAWRYVPMLTLAVILEAMSGLVGGVFSAERKSKYFFYSSLWGAGVSVALTWPFIKIIGLMGVPIATACSFLCMAIVRIRYAWKHINLFDVKYFAIVLIVYISFIVVTILDLGVLVTTVCFVVAVSVVAILSKNEVNAIYYRIRNRIPLNIKNRDNEENSNMG